RKGDRDPRIALIGRGAQLVDAADRVDRLLDPLGDLGLDFLGAGAREVGLDRHHRRVGLRHQVEAERFVGHGAEHDERRRHHDGDPRPVDAAFGEAHSRPPAPRRPPRPSRPVVSIAPSSSPPLAARTATPVASWLRFVVASVSSPFSPFVISTRFCCRAPSVTCCCRALPSSITYTVETPASVEIASSGAASTFSSRWVWTAPLAKKPGLSTRSPFSTSASTANVRVVWSTAGLT